MKDVYIIGLTDDLQTMLEETLVTMTTIRNSPFVSPIKVSNTSEVLVASTLSFINIIALHNIIACGLTLRCWQCWCLLVWPYYCNPRKFWWRFNFGIFGIACEVLKLIATESFLDSSFLW